MGTIPPQRIIEDALFGRPVAPAPPPQPAPFQNAQQPYDQRHVSPPIPTAANQWQPRPPTPPKNYSDPSNLEKAEVLYDIRKLLELRRSQLSANPSNRGNLDQINTLKQVSPSHFAANSCIFILIIILI